jgi:hypothetical protein
MRKPKAPTHHASELQPLRLVSPVSPVCILCGKGFARSLWAFVRARDGRGLVMHALPCFEQWRQGAEVTPQRAEHPTTGAE